MHGGYAYRIRGQRGAARGALETTGQPEPGAGDVVVRVRYAGVNYKDALAARGYFLPDAIDCIAGSEAVGEVAASRHAGLREGDAVIVHGRGLGMTRDGTFCPHVRLPGDWAVPLPDGLSAREAAALGSGGFVAALSLEALELNGLAPGAGPVAVTGASGGAGVCAVALLAARQYAVTALTRKAGTAGDLLRALGAAEVRPPPDEADLTASADGSGLGPETWAGALDAVGGRLLAWVLGTMARGAPVASFGVAGGGQLHTSLLPMMVRGVRLLGISSDVPPGHRAAVWARLAGPWRPREIARLARCIALEDLPDLLAAMLRGETVGRALVRFP
jgi:putative YhdH/YhfP family quinone oxidoreductase